MSKTNSCHQKLLSAKSKVCHSCGNLSSFCGCPMFFETPQSYIYWLDLKIKRLRTRRNSFRDKILKQ